MKSLILTALLSTACSLLADTPPEQQRTELKETMHTFVAALGLVQDGILYNSTEKMNEGIGILKATERDFLRRHGNTLQYYMNEDPTFAMSYARNASDKLHQHIRNLDNEVRFGQEYSKTAETYSRIVQICTECHQKFRK